jgi:Asparagine synthase
MHDAAGASLTQLELAWAVPLGADERTRELIGPPIGTGRDALEAVVRRALRRPPCVVSFSGGRDSSAVLALAVAVARSDGLPDPVPATNVFPTIASTDETFNSHFHVPLLEAAAGGSLLTGIGGDELFEPTRRGALARVIYGRQIPSRRQVKPLLVASLPRGLRTALLTRGMPAHSCEWIQLEARAEIVSLSARWHAREPTSYQASLTAWWWRSRMLQCNLAAKRSLAADHDVAIDHPFADPEVLVAYGSGRGRVGPPGRVWALRELLGDLLPASIIERTTKSSFDEAFWGTGSAEFARRWDGRGVDATLIDVDGLRTEWLRPQPDGHSFALLLQAFSAEMQSSKQEQERHRM